MTLPLSPVSCHRGKIIHKRFDPASSRGSIGYELKPFKQTQASLGIVLYHPLFRLDFLNSKGRELLKT